MKNNLLDTRRLLSRKVKKAPCFTRAGCCHARTLRDSSAWLSRKVRERPGAWWRARTRGSNAHARLRLEDGLCSICLQSQLANRYKAKAYFRDISK